MRNKILLEIILICILLFTPASGFSRTLKLDSPTEVRTAITKIVAKIKTEKLPQKKLKLLGDIKELLQKELASRFIETEKIYDLSLELQNLQIDKETVARAKEIIKLNKEFIQKKEIQETLYDFDFVFKNIFLLFLENKKSSSLNCSTIGSDIGSSYLNTAPEGTLLPYHAKVAIELVDDLCGSISKE